MSPELGRRVGFTLGALLVFRIGTYIPLPGIDLQVWERIFRSSGGGTLDLFNAASGGAVGRLAVFALGITPYVSAAIILQLVSFFVRRLRALRDSGDRGRQKIESYTRALTLLLAVFQGYGIAHAFESINGLVAEPGPLFQFTTALTLAGGAMFLTWLAGQITLRGFGNGVALLLCAGIVMELPRVIYGAFELHNRGLVSTGQILSLAGLAVLLVAIAAMVEGARRKVPVTFGGRERADSYLSFKLNSAGIIPALLASWLLTIPLVLWAAFDPSGSVRVRHLLQQGQTLHMICYAVLIFLSVYIYTALVLDPAQAAENLKRYGGTIPQVEPGEPTAAHLDSVLSPITLMGAVYFVVICLVPELLLYRAELPFYLGGTSLLILVCTVLDIEKQARSFASVR